MPDGRPRSARWPDTSSRSTWSRASRQDFVLPQPARRCRWSRVSRQDFVLPQPARRCRWSRVRDRTSSFLNQRRVAAGRGFRDRTSSFLNQRRVAAGRGFRDRAGPSSTSDVLPLVAGFEPGASATLARMGGEDDAMSVYDADWARLRDAARGRDVLEAEALVRGWAGTHARYITDLDVALMARVMSDPRWSRRHPLSAIVLAWRHRGSRPVHRTLRQLWRPRFAG